MANEKEMDVRCVCGHLVALCLDAPEYESVINKVGVCSNCGKGWNLKELNQEELGEVLDMLTAEDEE